MARGSVGSWEIARGFDSPVPPLKIWTLLSWYDERPDWLAEMVRSVSALVDGVIAVDGPYPLTPHEAEESPREQRDTLCATCETEGLELELYSPGAMSEVDKRAFMFHAALRIAEPMEDWFLIMDADMWMGRTHRRARETREALARTEHHAAEVTFHNLGPEIDGNPKIRPFRSLFRAIPGLTVEGSHSTYTVPDFNGKRLLMWQSIGDRQPVPALDLTREIHLLHRPHLREPARQAVRVGYYDRRATAGIEQVPDYVEE